MIRTRIAATSATIIKGKCRPNMKCQPNHHPGTWAISTHDNNNRHVHHHHHHHHHHHDHHHYYYPSRDSRCRDFSSMPYNTYSSDQVIQPYDEIPDEIMEMVLEYCKRDKTPVPLSTLLKTGRKELLGKTYKQESMMGSLNQHFASGRVLIQVANFLRSELPVRLAHRIQDLDMVPVMRDVPSVQLVKGIYINSFVDLVRFYGADVIRSNEDEAAFAYFLEKKYETHSNVLIQMARGAYELRQALRLKQGSMSSAEQQDSQTNHTVDFSQLQECHAFLDRFYMSRIGIRVLAGQYLALRQPPVSPNYIGMICLKTSPYHIVKQAARDATSMCQKKYGEAPEVIINGRLDLTFPYIPTYLHYMLLELIKNAMRATMEKYNNNNNATIPTAAPTTQQRKDDNQNQETKKIPPVMVIIADGQDNEDVVIKVADVGGGISRSNMKKIWSYLFTTADPKIQEDFIGDKDHDPSSSPLAGLGFGLPISRSYARYFHGDLNIMSMEGYGTDAYIHLPRLDDPHQEFS